MSRFDGTGKVGDAGGQVTLTRTPLFGSQEERAAAIASPTPHAQGQSDHIEAEGFGALLDSTRMPAETIDAMHAWATGTAPAATADDKASAAASEQALRRIWGNDFDRNTKALRAYVDRLPEDERKLLTTARDPSNGELVGNDPAVAVAIAGVARRPQPQAMTRAGIEQFMRTHPGEYRNREDLGARYREILDAELPKGS